MITGPLRASCSGQPNLLILDEATGAPCAPAPRAIKNVDLRPRAQGEGRVIEEGTYHELRARENGEFREMVEMQSL